MIINYEDIVLNYETTVRKIEQYLEYEPNQHLRMFKNFDPKTSNRFVGIYKSMTSDDISIIHSELKTYCNPLID